MPTIRQITANRLNAQKSTGPRSAEGKAVARFNALKHGIDARQQIIFDEKSGDLEALSAEYRDQFAPSNASERFLVDALVHAEWLLRRLRRVEAELWDLEAQRLERLGSPVHNAGKVFSNTGDAFLRVQRRIDSAERNYHRALKAVQQLVAARPVTPPPSPTLSPAPSTRPAPQPESQPIGFVSHPPVDIAATPVPERIGFVPQLRSNLLRMSSPAHGPKEPPLHGSKVSGLKVTAPSQSLVTFDRCA